MQIEPGDSHPNVGCPTEPDVRFSVVIAALKARAGQLLRSRWLPPALIGLALALLVLCSGPTLDAEMDVALSDGSVAALLRSDKVRLYAAQQAKPRALPTAVQIKRFSAALRTLQAYGEHADPRLLDQTRALLESVKYQLIPGTDGYWYLRDGLAARGWGGYVVNRAPRDRLLVEVPRPLDEVHAMEAGTAMLYETGAQALAVAGPVRAQKRGADAPTARGTFFHAFHRIYAHDSVLAVRSAAIAPTESSWTPGGVSRLWVNKNLPAAIEIEQLRALVGTLVVIWKAPPVDNLQRRTTPRGYVELYLNGDDASSLVARLENHSVMQADWQPDGVKAQLDDWLLADATTPSSGKIHSLPRQSQLAFFDREVLGPLLRITETGYSRGTWSLGARAQLRALHYVAQGMGYGITRLRDTKARQEYLVLHETPRVKRGRYVLRAGGGDDYAVHVPDARRESKALEYGLTLFQSLKARALLVAGDTPQAFADSGAAMESERSDAGVFALVNQVLKRELGEQAFMTVISRSRSRSIAPPQADVSLAIADGTMSRGEATPLTKQLLSAVERSGLSYRFVDAAKDAAGSQTSVMDKEVATLWLSPHARVAHGSLHNAPVHVSRNKTRSVIAHPGDTSDMSDHATTKHGGNSTRTAFLDLDGAQ